MSSPSTGRATSAHPSALAVEGWEPSRAARRIPAGVVLVAGLVAGEPVGMVVSTLTLASEDPPLVGYLPRRASRTHRRLDAAAVFGASVLGAGQAAVSHRFSNPGGAGFAGLGWHRSPGGAPLVDGCVSWLEFVRDAVVDVGDHLFVTGRITAAGGGRGAALVYQDGGFGRVVLAPGRRRQASAWSTAPSQSSPAPARRAAS